MNNKIFVKCVHNASCADYSLVEGKVYFAQEKVANENGSFTYWIDGHCICGWYLEEINEKDIPEEIEVIKNYTVETKKYATFTFTVEQILKMLKEHLYEDGQIEKDSIVSLSRDGDKWLITTETK